MATTTMRPAPPRATRATVPWGPLLVVFAGIIASWSSLSGTGAVVVAVVIAIAAAIAVVRNPFVGVVVYLCTFLLTYPAPLRAFVLGNITINNVLGVLLLPIMLYGTLRDGLGWFLKQRPLVLLLPIAGILLTAGVLYNTELELGGQASLELRAGVERVVGGARRTEGPQLISTRDVRVRFLTRYVFLLFFVFFVRTPRQMRIVVAVLIGVLLLTTANLTTEAGAAGWGRGRLKVAGGRAGAALYTGTNPNKLAFYSLFILVLLWYWRTRVRSLLAMPVWAGMAGTALVIVPMTGSRSGFLGLLVFLSVTLLEGRFSYRKVLGLVLISCLAVAQLGYNVNVLDLLLPEEGAARISRLLPGQGVVEGQTTIGSFQRRASNVTAALQVIKLHPVLGVGVGNFVPVREAIDPTGLIGPPHNSYLLAAAEGGLVTLLLYLLMFIWILRRLHNLLQDYEGRFGPVDMKWLVNAMRTSMILFLMFSLFADVWSHIFFYLIVGLSMAVIQLHATYAETGQVAGSDPGPPLSSAGRAI